MLYWAYVPFFDGRGSSSICVFHQQNFGSFLLNNLQLTQSLAIFTVTRKNGFRCAGRRDMIFYLQFNFGSLNNQKVTDCFFRVKGDGRGLHEGWLVALRQNFITKKSASNASTKTFQILNGKQGISLHYLGFSSEHGTRYLYNSIQWALHPTKEVERQEVKKNVRWYCKLTVQTDISWLLSQLSDTGLEAEANLRRE